MLFKLYFMAIEAETFFNGKHNNVMDGILMSHASNQMLFNVWPYHMTLGYPLNNSNVIW